MLLSNLGSGDKLSDLSTLKDTGPIWARKQAWYAYAYARQVYSKGNLPRPRGGVAEVFRAPEETCRRRAGDPRLLPPGCCPLQLVSRPNAFQSSAQDTLLQAVLETRARSGRGREGARGRR